MKGSSILCLVVVVIISCHIELVKLQPTGIANSSESVSQTLAKEEESPIKQISVKIPVPKNEVFGFLDSKQEQQPQHNSLENTKEQNLMEASRINFLRQRRSLAKRAINKEQSFEFDYPEFWTWKGENLLKLLTQPPPQDSGYFNNHYSDDDDDELEPPIELYGRKPYPSTVLDLAVKPKLRIIRTDDSDAQDLSAHRPRAKKTSHGYPYNFPYTYDDTRMLHPSRAVMFTPYGFKSLRHMMTPNFPAEY